MGDFNEVLDHGEVMGRRVQPMWQLQDFREAVVFCDLHDLGYQGNMYTGWNNKEDLDFVTARLDRMLASATWISAFDGSVVSHLPVQNSDHCPLLLSIPEVVSVSKKNKIFRFEAMWIKDDQCKEVIEQDWGEEVAFGSSMFQVMEKLKVAVLLWLHGVGNDLGP
jgi:hypothetical protein